MEYKGYKIELNENTGEFTLRVDGEDYFSSTNLVEVKAIVDKLIKKVFKRIPAYILGDIGYSYGDDETYTEIEITSISPIGEVWIVDKKKNREKRHKEIFKRNAKNLIILKEIKKYKEEIVRIEKKVDNLEEGLEPIKLPEIKDES